MDHKKAGDSTETSNSASLTTQNKAFDSVDYNKLWKIFQQPGVTEKHTCLQQALHTGQEATVRIRHGMKNCVKFGKGEHQGCIL